MEPVVCSLVYFVRGSQVNLPFSLSGPTKGKRSSYGGKQEPAETIYDSGIRETIEESGGVVISSMNKRGVMLFHWDGKIDVPGLGRPGQSVVEVHIYTTSDWEGALAASDTFNGPQWFNFNEIPYHQMMPCEELWFAQLLAGNPFTGEMSYQKVEGQILCRGCHLHKRPFANLLNKP